jgi:hypothetical protein
MNLLKLLENIAYAEETVLGVSDARFNRQSDQNFFFAGVCPLSPPPSRANLIGVDLNSGRVPRDRGSSSGEGGRSGGSRDNLGTVVDRRELWSGRDI